MAFAPDWPLTALESAVVEENALALGVSTETLMENAGRVVAEEATHVVPPAPVRIAVVAGPGNNGGDGTAAAFYLHEWGYSPEVWMVRPPGEIRGAAARRCYERIADRVPIHGGIPTADALREFRLVIDALLGTGQSGPLRSPFRESVQEIRESGAPALSVDLPTGFGGPDALRPQWTVALTARKVGMATPSCGDIRVRDIGIPAEAHRSTGPGEFLFFPAQGRRASEPRKARVVVIGGGPFAGAPALAGLAALRSGAERATVLVPEPAAGQVQVFSPNLVVHTIGTTRFEVGDAPTISAWLHGAPVDCVVVGMGVGREPGTVAALSEVLNGILGRIPVVVDADGLSALPPVAPPGAPAESIVATPNDLEYERVFGGSRGLSTEARLTEAREFARQRGLTILVKGETDLITDGKRDLRNTHHHPSQSVAGVGDVLGGVLGSLLAQGVPSFAACRLATYWVGEAGVRAAERNGFGLVATDVLDELPRALVAGLARVHRAS